MTREQMLAIFLLAGIHVDSADELPNGYWPNAERYLQIRADSPWWLVHTEFGMVKIGWRKRVISITWERTKVRAIVTRDEVTKDETCAHAWSYAEAVKYLTEFRRVASLPEPESAREQTPASSEQAG